MYYFVICQRRIWFSVNRVVTDDSASRHSVSVHLNYKIPQRYWKVQNSWYLEKDGAIEDEKNNIPLEVHTVLQQCTCLLSVCQVLQIFANLSSFTNLLYRRFLFLLAVNVQRKCYTKIQKI